MNEPEGTSTKPKAWIIGLLFLFGVTVWQVFRTEMQVANLRSQGFSEFVIDSTRNHAYFPLFGGIMGAALFIGLVAAIKRTLRKRQDSDL